MTFASPAAPYGGCHHHRRSGFWLSLMAAPERGDMPPFRGGDPRSWGPWGPGGHGPGHRGRRGRRARRGDIRAAVLLLLAEEPRNGYGLMQEIEERSGGVWRPSPGSVYPVLAQLEDEGLVRAVQDATRKLYELTDTGREHVEERRERFGLPWETAAGQLPDELHELRVAAKGLAIAAMQVGQTGTATQLAEARRILDDARRALYRLLAGDEPEA